MAQTSQPQPQIHAKLQQPAPPPNPQQQQQYLRQLKLQEIELDIDSDILLSKLSFDPTSQPHQKPIMHTPKTAQPSFMRKSKPYCGCGQYYSCTSSLYLHIRTKHSGIPPPGTIGGPKGIVKKNPPPHNVKVQTHQHTNSYITTHNNTIKHETQPHIHQPHIHPQVYNQMTYRTTHQTAQQTPKICHLCNRYYSCNSSLNLHLKRKHNMRRNQDGKTSYQKRQEERPGFTTYSCKMCECSFGSKSALGLHFNTKHSSQIQKKDGIPYDQSKVQKCGCGLVYQSRSALNMHVKKKHDSIYPPGTTQRMTRAFPRWQYQQKAQRNNPQNESIYDSASEDRQRSRQRQHQAYDDSQHKPFKCGCGRAYTCSSSLNLHIKKNHNWVVPEGTIGGPRGLRIEDDPRGKPDREMRQAQLYQEVTPQKEVQTALICSECQVQTTKRSYFKCQNCISHLLCSKCFWSKNNFTNDHEWEVFTHSS